MLPSGVRRRALIIVPVVVGIASGRLARADPRDAFDLDKKPAADPRDAFDLDKKPPPPPAAKCDDGRAFDCAVATDPLDPSVSYALSTWLPTSYLLRLPVADATSVDVAHFALGAGQDEVGPFFRGANGLENRWTIDGAPADNIRTGGSDTAVPLTFLDGILVTAGGFAARDRVSTGGTIDARLIRGGDDHVLDTHLWLSWTADPRQPPLATGTYFTRQVSASFGPAVTASVVGSGPIGELAGGKVWYAAGIAPNLAATDLTWHAASVIDANGDMVPDGFPGAITTSPIETTSHTRVDWFVPLMARTGYDNGAHHVELTLVGDVSHQTSYLGNATLQAAGVDELSYVGDAIATYHGVWTDTRVNAQLAWHRGVIRESAHDPAAADIPQLLSAYIPRTLPEDPALAAACDDSSPSDPFPTVPNCPVPFGFFASGGAGELVDSFADRPTVTADIAHKLGDNVVRGGATLEDTRLVTESRFTGGEQIRSLFVGHTDELRFVDPDACPPDPAQPCAYRSTSTQTYRTRYAAAYAEDTFTIMPGLQVDGGLRWELMWVGSALHFSDELAPRLGVTWDFLGDGRSRAWLSMGRSFTLLPAGLGPTILSRDPTVRDVTTPVGAARSIDGGGVFPVAGDVLPMAQDELTAGLEAVLPHAFKATLWGQGAWLRRSLDTTATDFENPGNGVLPATRSTAIVAAELSTAPTGDLTLRIGYAWGTTVGTTTGAFDPRQGAVLYAGSDYNASAINLTGTLPTSLGNRFYFEADQHGHLAGLEVALSTRLTLASGRPRDAIGNTPEGVFELLPRGSEGRGPMITQTNIELRARWHDIDFTLDVFNLFDHRDAVNVDQVYTSDSVQPIDGGTANDLIFLKNAANKPAIRSTGYLLPTAFQLPTTLTLGIRHSF